MTTLENTISMMKALPESDLLEIQKLAAQLFQRHREGDVATETADEAVGKFLKQKSKEEIMQDLAISRQQAAEGKYMEMGQAIERIRVKYGI